MDKCKKTLEEAKKALAEFNPETTDSRLIIYGTSGSLDFVFTAECTNQGKLLILTGVPRFFEKLPPGDPGKKLLEALLDLAGREYILTSKVDNNLLLAEPAPTDPTPTTIQRFFSLTALIILWLTKQLENAAKGKPIKPFTIEEITQQINNT